MQEGCRQWLPLEALQASNANPTASASSSTGAPKSSVMPHPVTQPRPPVATRTRRRRAPPVSTAGVGPARVLSCSALGKTSASGSSIAAAAVATPDVITHLHKHLPAPGSAHSQDTERLTALQSKVTSSSSISVLAAAEADLLSAQAQLVGANARLMTAQALHAEFDTALYARRASSKKGRARRWSARVCLFSSSLFLYSARVVSPSPPARPKPVRPSAPPCDLHRRPSARLKCPCTTPRRGTSPHSHSYFYTRPRPLLYCLVHSIHPRRRSIPSLSLSVRARIRDCAVRTYRLERWPAALVGVSTLRQSPPRRVHCTTAHLRAPSSVPAPLASRPSPLSLPLSGAFTHTAHPSPGLLFNGLTRKYPPRRMERQSYLVPILTIKVIYHQIGLNWTPRGSCAQH
ncbi:hypothetical protein FB451DRAFT_1379311 [Mycena latifolia]|nr:hypothetical protein FB451DRAFT_1379311 [Mycena latifolia]